MNTQGFRVFASANKGGNDVAIAVKSSYPILQVVWKASHGRDQIPENLRVDIELDGQAISILGVRIKEVRSQNHEILQKARPVDIHQAENRRTECANSLSWVAKLDYPVLIGGDFNTYRENTCVEKWNSHVLGELAKKEGFSVVCPEHGSSLFGESGPNEFRYDRFLTKGFSTIGEPVYDRGFVTHTPHIYLRGRDLYDILPGYPDHASLKSTFELNN